MSRCRNRPHSALALFLGVSASFSLVGPVAAAMERPRDVADSLASAGFYYDAVTEYKRQLFLEPEDGSSDSVLAALGRCYARLGEWESAVAAMGRAIRGARDQRTFERRVVDRAVVYMAAGMTREAKDDVSALARASRFDDVREDARELLFLAQVFSHEWGSALETCRSLLAEGRAGSDTLTMLIEEAEGTRDKSPLLAGVLSTVIPGAGQAYCGAYRAALNAFVLDVTLGYAVVESIVEEEYLPGFLAFTFVFQRYYGGNIYQAQRAAVDRNQRMAAYYENLIVEYVKTAKPFRRGRNGS